MRNVNGKFVDVSKQSGPVFEEPRAARGAAFGDLDNDGFVDIVVNCNAQPAKVLHNQGNEGNWLIVDTGVGARLRLVTESGPEHHSYVSTAGSYMSSSDQRVNFGLGANQRVRLLEIVWPSLPKLI